jgi:dolichol-phosphate mannosyltransferase
VLVSIVVPTYREAENLPFLIDRVAGMAKAHALDVEMIVVDDDSRDGAVAIVESRPEPWVRIVVRSESVA